MTEGSAQWRIISSPAADGATNMAIDESILEAVRQEQSPPTLRLYTWKPACLSIGRFQRAARSVDFDALTSLGYDFVRRPTGGRAVLHDDELTYAVIASTTQLAGTGGSVRNWCARYLSDTQPRARGGPGQNGHPCGARAARRRSGPSRLRSRPRTRRRNRAPRPDRRVSGLLRFPVGLRTAGSPAQDRGIRPGQKRLDLPAARVHPHIHELRGRRSRYGYAERLGHGSVAMCGHSGRVCRGIPDGHIV